MNYQRQRTSRFGLTVGACLSLGILAGACSASNNGTIFGTGGSGGAPSDKPDDSSGSGPSDTGDSLTTAATGTGSGSIGEGCASSTTKAELIPLDMYIMLDQSGSMVEGGSPKWDQVTGALGTFLQQPSAAGIGVGIGFFPQLCPLSCNNAGDCGATCGSCSFGGCYYGGLSSCDAGAYAKPAVEIAQLPDASNSIIQAMGSANPDGGTPTSSALKGAIQHAQEWATKNPTHMTIVVFATDGEPSECSPTTSSGINAIAATGVNGTPKILTYVIGVGKSLTALNGMAASGGTGKAFIIDTAQNPGEQFLEAMNKIRGAALACSYLIPEPMAPEMPDFNLVNVQYSPGDSSKPVYFPKVADKAKCEPGVDAWYYDNNAAPKQIILCDSTCTKLSADTKGKVDIVLGCGTIVK